MADKYYEGDNVTCRKIFGWANAVLGYPKRGVAAIIKSPRGPDAYVRGASGYTARATECHAHRTIPNTFLMRITGNLDRALGARLRGPALTEWEALRLELKDVTDQDADTDFREQPEDYDE